MINLTDVLGWGSSDVDFLNNRLNEFKISPDEILLEIEGTGYDKTNINDWIYFAFYIAAFNFLQKLQDYKPDFNVDDIEIEIFCNYLDSGFFNGAFCDIDVMDFSNKNFDNFIAKNS